MKKTKKLVLTAAALAISVGTTANLMPSVSANQLSTPVSASVKETGLVNGDFSNGLTGWNQLVIDPADSIKVLSEDGNNIARLSGLNNITALQQTIKVNNFQITSGHYSVRGQGHVLVMLTDGTVVSETTVNQDYWSNVTFSSNTLKNNSLKVVFSTSKCQTLDVENVSAN